jgi:hypothetical protein
MTRRSFITGLTFVTEGSLTGTMTPLTQVVPEAVPLPATVVLLGAGLAAMALGWRRK